MRVARAAHLFVLTRPVKFLISGVVIYLFFAKSRRVARAARLFLFIRPIMSLFSYALALPKRHSKINFCVKQ